METFRSKKERATETKQAQKLITSSPKAQEKKIIYMDSSQGFIDVDKLSAHPLKEAQKKQSSFTTPPFWSHQHLVSRREDS